MRKLPKNFGQNNRKSGMDAIDLEAESQGNARKVFRENWSPENAPQGRRLVKNHSKETRGAAIVACKRIKNLETDHNIALTKYMI